MDKDQSNQKTGYETENLLDQPIGQQLINWYARKHDVTLCNQPIQLNSILALENLIKKILLPVYEKYSSIDITYGFTSFALKKYIAKNAPKGTAPELDQHASCELNNAHSLICNRGGASCDFIIPNVPSSEVVLFIVENLDYDRIYYYGDNMPLHVSSAEKPAKHLQIMSTNDKGQRYPAQRAYGTAALEMARQLQHNATTNINIGFYNQHATKLFEQYESASFEHVHYDWLHLLPEVGSVLDVGAGSGRDSAFMASKGLTVFAIEPATNLRTLASANHPADNITWLADKLPNLSNPIVINTRYDLILLSAIWMHLSPFEREKSIHQLCNLLNPHANMIITLRHGKASDERQMLPVSYAEIQSFLTGTKFTCKLLNKSDSNSDVLGRKDVSWQTVHICHSDINQ